MMIHWLNQKYAIYSSNSPKIILLAVLQQRQPDKSSQKNVHPIINTCSMCISYLTVISNKEELNVFLLLDNRYTLENERVEQIKAPLKGSELHFCPFRIY